MTLNELLAELRDRQVELVCVSGELRFRAPKGALTDEIRETLKANKEEIIRIVGLGPAYQLAEPCSNCGTNRFRYEPLAFDLAGGHVCKECRHTVRA